MTRELTEAQRGMLMSSMSVDSCAMMMGRSAAWVKRHRLALAELPQASPVQVRAALAAKPWEPEADAFAPAVPEPTAAGDPDPGPPARSWRDAGAEAVRRSPRSQLQAAPALTARRTWKSERATDMAAAFEAPAVLTPDPALLSEKHFEREFVRTKRAAGVSWFNIAMMTGKTVPYLKANYA